MLAYLGLEKAKEEATSSNESSGNLPDNLHLPEMSCSLVERVIKIFKKPHSCHRNVYNYDRPFLDAVVGIMKKTTSVINE